MSSSDIGGQVRRLRRRVRLLMVERWSLIGAAAGLGASAVLVMLSGRFESLLNYTLWAAVVITGAAVGAAVGLLRKFSDLAVAASADRRAGLSERLSTAVCLGSPDDEVAAAVVDDAGSHISQLPAREVFRHRFALPHWIFAGALVVFLAVLVVPQVPGLQGAQRREEVAVMKKEGEKIRKLGTELSKQARPSRAYLQRLAQRLQKLGWKMETGRMAKKQAMLQTRRLSEQIRAEQDRLARESTASKSLEQAQAEMARAGQSLAQKAADEIAKKEHIPPAEALKKVPSDKRLAELARKPGPLNRAQRQELERALQRYADPNDSTPIPSELGEAMAKLAANGDYRKAAELMSKLAQKMNSPSTARADREAIAKQMEQLAKALQNTDLDKLAKQMLESAQKLSQMSPQELAELAKQAQQMQQLAKSLEQAGGT